MEFQKKNVRKEMVKTYVTIEEKALLHAFFARQGLSISDGVRQILLTTVQEMEGSKDAKNRQQDENKE